MPGSTCWWKSRDGSFAGGSRPVDCRIPENRPHPANRATWSASIRRSLRCRRSSRSRCFLRKSTGSAFSRRGALDIDVVYDVMIHDLDILLSLVDAPVTDPESGGHSGHHWEKVDIAQARVEFFHRHGREPHGQPRFHRARAQKCASSRRTNTFRSISRGRTFFAFACSQAARCLETISRTFPRWPRNR